MACDGNEALALIFSSGLCRTSLAAVSRGRCMRFVDAWSERGQSTGEAAQLDTPQVPVGIRVDAVAARRG